MQGMPAPDRNLLASFPEGHRHLAHMQARIGYKVKTDMPGLDGPEVDALYAIALFGLQRTPGPYSRATSGLSDRAVYLSKEVRLGAGYFRTAPGHARLPVAV